MIENLSSISWWIFQEVIVVNAYMLWIELWMMKYIYVEWIMNVLVIAYMLGDDELLVNS